MQTRTVSSIEELAEALGGPTAAARALGSTPQKVGNWRRDGAMPARLYLRHQEILKRHRIKAPPSLWGMAEPTVHRRAGDEQPEAAA